MDAFEFVVAAILERHGFWTRTSVMVELTKEEKRKIGRHSSPRWELDVVAYSGARNELRVVECKSYLDSRGVHHSAFDGSNAAFAKRFKLFHEATLRKLVLRKLTAQLVKAGFCARRPRVKLCLAAGKVNGDEQWIHRHFARHGWVFYGPEFIREELRELRDIGYENSVAAVVTKLLLRASTPANIRGGVRSAEDE